MLRTLQISRLLVVAACCVLGSGASHAATTTVTGQLLGGAPTYHRMSDRQSGGVYVASSNLAVPYAVHEIRMPSSGSIQVVVDSATPFDSFLSLYSNFNPANPQAGLLAADDDAAVYPRARLSVSGLKGGTSYWLVISAYSNQPDAVYPPYGSYSMAVTVTAVDLSPTMLLLLD